MHIDHIGIAVEDLEDAIDTYENLLSSSCYKREVVEGQQVETAFFKSGESKVELLGATDDSSVIAKYVDKKGSGLHHVAFEVEDIQSEMKRLQKQGYRLLSEEPQAGADNKWIIFIHPEDTHGVLVELCQTRE